MDPGFGGSAGRGDSSRGKPEEVELDGSGDCDMDGGNGEEDGICTSVHTFAIF